MNGCAFFVSAEFFAMRLSLDEADGRLIGKEIIMARLEQQIQFIVEVDKVKQIFRQTYLADATRKENDAEHSWHLALMACLLKEHVSEPVDVARVTTMVLIHDLVEIDAGDTYAYDPEGAKTKAEREQKAAERIFGLLPKDQGDYFMELWQEFEGYQTPDAKYPGNLPGNLALHTGVYRQTCGGRTYKRRVKRDFGLEYACWRREIGVKDVARWHYV